MTKQTIQIADVPETMLWTLHNRAYEASHPNHIINDPKCLEIYQALNYDYEKSFGKPDGSHGVRSFIFDEKIREFLKLHPDGVIVNLGEGLETQRYRVNNEEALWISLDLPEGIAIREKFIAPDEKHIHLGMSAFDTGWFNKIPENRAVFVTAQGLFMFFPEEQVKQLFQLIAQRLPGAWLMFDHIPRWLSKKTLTETGWQKTPYYTAPKMPWGINRNEILPTLTHWLGKNICVERVEFKFPRGKHRYLMSFVELLPILKNKMYGITLIRMAKKS